MALPERADDFAAHSLFLRFAVAHHAVAGRDDADSQTLQNLGHLIDAGEDASTGRADAAQMLDHPLAVGSVFELDPQRVLRLGLDDFVIPDVALALEHARNAHLDP